MSFFEAASGLVYAIPAALIIVISREWYADKMSGLQEIQPLKDFPLLSFASLCLTGGAPGGLIVDKPAPTLRYFYGQLWLIILIIISIIYVLIKGPAVDSFAARFAAVFLSQLWTLFILNLIPIPPFDAAIFYFAPYMQWRAFSIMVTALSFIAIFLLGYTFWRTDLLSGKFLLRWLSLV